MRPLWKNRDKKGKNWNILSRQGNLGQNIILFFFNPPPPVWDIPELSIQGFFYLTTAFETMRNCDLESDARNFDLESDAQKDCDPPSGYAMRTPSSELDKN